MTPAEARDAVAAAAQQLGIRGVLTELAHYAEALLDSATESNDKVSRQRAATDHRSLVNLKDRVYN